MKMTLTRKILIGMASGLLVGLLIRATGPTPILDSALINGVFDVIGRIFIASLKVLVVPLVFISLVTGAAAIKDIKKIGSIGGRVLAYYLATTAIAIAVALTAAIIFDPGEGLSLETSKSYVAKEAPPITEIIVNIFPTNPVKAMAEGNMLQIIVFSILVGLTLTMSGNSGHRILEFFKDLNEVVMKMVHLLMELAPYGVFCLIAKVFASQGLDAILPLAKYFLVVVGVLLFHGGVVYPTLLVVFGKLNPVIFFKKMKAVWAFSFSTASSNATLPITLETVEEEMGVDNSIASFTIPLGATINMDGTAIMQGVATVFIAQVYGVHLSPADLLMVVLTATLASIGTAGVPGVGLITLAMVLRQANLPVEGISLIIGVDRLLDMARTMVNVTGDCAVTCTVAKQTRHLDLRKYKSFKEEKA